jgi:hypothetical protein
MHQQLHRHHESSSNTHFTPPPERMNLWNIYTPRIYVHFPQSSTLSTCKRGLSMETQTCRFTSSSFLNTTHKQIQKKEKRKKKKFEKSNLETGILHLIGPHFFSFCIKFGGLAHVKQLEKIKKNLTHS